VNGAILLITALISTQKFTHRRVNITLKIDVTNAILSRDFVAQVRDFIARQSRARCDYQVARCDFVA